MLRSVTSSGAKPKSLYLNLLNQICQYIVPACIVGLLVILQDVWLKNERVEDTSILFVANFLMSDV